MSKKQKNNNRSRRKTQRHVVGAAFKTFTQPVFSRSKVLKTEAKSIDASVFFQSSGVPKLDFSEII